MSSDENGLEIKLNHCPKDEREDGKQVWENIIRWIRGDGKTKSDGFVHESLTLKGKGPSRGVFATSPIQPGELLISITSRHILSGEDCDDVTKAGEPLASPWLRCVAAFLKAKQRLSTSASSSTDGSCDASAYRPYLQSLPTFDEYETLQKWSTEEIGFLTGTTLGSLLRIDRETDGTRTQYSNSVRPYLEKVGIVNGWTEKDHEKIRGHGKQEEGLYQSFLEASMCISTRGFHLLPTTDDKTTISSAKNHITNYDGPFLLPIIDLLNHDPSRACTTLRRHETADDNAKSCFRMVAERQIGAGEEIFHSYGTNLTSAQLLQTFGFVPRYHSSTISSENATPVGLRKFDHFITAANNVKKSAFPDSLGLKVQGWLQRNGEDSECDEYEDYCWEVHEIPDRTLEDTKAQAIPNVSSMDDQFLISASALKSNNDTGVDKGREAFLLTEDLITLMAAQFLPDEAFFELFPSGIQDTVRLDRSVLREDYYLGMLVSKALIVAIGLKVKEYCTNEDISSINSKKSQTDGNHELAEDTANGVGSSLDSIIKRERERINDLLASNAPLTVTMQRELYGRTIRMEELGNLSAFFQEIEELTSSISLDDDPNDETRHDLLEASSDRKRHKMQ